MNPCPISFSFSSLVTTSTEQRIGSVRIAATCRDVAAKHASPRSARQQPPPTGLGKVARQRQQEAAQYVRRTIQERQRQEGQEEALA